jgi:hypothetical protein
MRCGQLLKLSAATSLKVSPARTHRHLVLELAEHLGYFSRARLELILFYKFLYYYLASGTFADHAMEMIRRIRQNLRVYSGRFDLPLMIPLKKTYNNEIRSLWHVCCTQFYQIQMEMTGSLIHLNELLGQLEAWKLDSDQSRHGPSERVPPPTPKQNLHIVWLNNVAIYLTSRQTILFQRPLQGHLDRTDPFYLFLQKLFVSRSDVNPSIYLIADGMQSLSYAMDHLNTAAWFKSFVSQTGYTLPGLVTREDLKDCAGLQLFPCLFAYPTEGATRIRHWPNIISIIQDLGPSTSLPDNSQKSSTPLQQQDPTSFQPIKPISPPIHYFYDKRARCIYYIGEMLPSASPTLKTTMENEDIIDPHSSSTIDGPLFVLPSFDHPRPSYWGVLVIEAKDIARSTRSSPTFWSDPSKDTQFNDWMQQWIRLFRLTNLADLLLSLAS